MQNILPCCMVKKLPHSCSWCEGPTNLLQYRQGSEQWIINPMIPVKKRAQCVVHAQLSRRLNLSARAARLLSPLLLALPLTLCTSLLFAVVMPSPLSAAGDGVSSMWNTSGSSATQATPASAGDSVVYYRLEEVVVDGDEVEVLLPGIVFAPQGALLPQLQEYVFRVLKERRPQLYGSTSIYVNPDRSVTVYPAPELSGNEHNMARMLGELVYSLTEQGASRVYVSEYRTSPLGREDVDQFTVFLSVAPVWRVLPPQPMLPGLIRFSDGRILDSETVRSMIGNKDKLIADATLEALKSNSVAQVLAGMNSLRAMEVKDAQTYHIALLEHQSPQVRAAAAGELARTDGEHDEAMALEAAAARMTREDNAGILGQLATFLRKSSNPEYGQHAWLYDLKYGDETSAVQAARALGASGRQAGVAGLAAAAANSQSGELRLEAVKAIAAIGDQRQLATLLAHPQVPGDVKTAAAHHLARSKNPEEAMNGWVYLLQKGEDVALAVEAAGALAGGGDKRAVAWLVQTVEQHSAVEVRMAASRALGELGDARAVDVLVRRAGAGECAGVAGGVGGSRLSEECVLHGEQAVRIMAGQSVDVVLKLAREGGLTGVRRLAIEALGQKFGQLSRDKRSSDQVLALLKDIVGAGVGAGASVGGSGGSGGGSNGSSGAALEGQNQTLVVAAILALGETGHPKAMDLIVGQADNPASAVRGAVASSLRKLTPPVGNETLYKLIDDMDDEVRLQAVAAARKRKDEGAVEYLIKYRSHGNSRLREEVLWALAEINPVPWQSTLRDVFSESVFASESNMRLAAVEGLSRIKNPRVLDIMAVLLQDRDKKVQLATIKAYGTSGFAQALQPLESLLQVGEDETVRIAAAKAIKELGSRGVEGVEPVLRRAIDGEKSQSLRETFEQILMITPQ